MSRSQSSRNHRLTAFLYALAERKIPLGELEDLVEDTEKLGVKAFDKNEFENHRLALQMRGLADRLIKKGASAKLREHLDRCRPKG